MHQLLLKFKSIHGLPAPVVINQIIGRKKAREKLPSFYSTGGIIYPPQLNIEQSSSEKTALFKSRLLPKGILVVDLTGGFGVDSYFLSLRSAGVHYVEPHADLLHIARHNHQTLKARNITYTATTAETFLTRSSDKPDWIYIDPSRRIEGNRKVIRLRDCEPDVIALQDKIFNIAPGLMIKTSPLLDIQAALADLKFVKQVVVLSVDNECKELLFLAERSFTGKPEIQAVNLLTDREQVFRFFLEHEKTTTVSFGDPGKYLFEPNASILKAGAFKSVAKEFGVTKLHPSTHLYTGSEPVRGFPGRSFHVIDIVKPEPKAVKEYFPGGQANVLVRNYPLSPEALKKKTGLKDGGNLFLIGFTGGSKKFLAVCEMVQQL